ncbi:MAG: hypothetical protein GXO83_04525 [Chlorobi bacterium]|nr:hypothetical protein [Chlorobiota bacterium]
MKISRWFLMFIGLFIIPQVFAVDLSLFSGKWKLIEGKSEPIPLFGKVTLDILTDHEKTEMHFTWGKGSRLFKDTIQIIYADQTVKWLSSSRVFPYNVFLGIKVLGDQQITGKYKIIKDRNVILLERIYSVQGSQGSRSIHETNRLVLTFDGNQLEFTVDIPEIFGNKRYKYVFKRDGYREAYIVYLSDNWKVKESLDIQVLLLSLQGLVNRQGPRLYFIYPDNWDYRFTSDIYNFLQEKKDFSFTTMTSLEDLMDTFRKEIHGYIVWDTDKPVSLDAALTVAGLKDAVVISEDLIPFAKSAGLEEKEDFRGVFQGLDDAEIFKKVYEEYDSMCNKDMIVWLGGESGEEMKPGIADWGIMNRTFFTNLSTDPSDTAEYLMSKKIMQGQHPFGLVFGWHTYKKDKERDHVKLASSFGLRVEGLHTLPNMSFMHHIPVSPGYHFVNNHSPEKALKRKPEKKVYISFVQTDCLGLGAWNQPGRGTLPYAWEVTMNWYWLAPAMLEYFYSEATGKDYFIGSLSGPGYIYPKAVPYKYLPALIDSAYLLMKNLDLNVFEIMDYSEGATIEGNTELTKKVVDTYYKRMPGCLGFVNGYAPAYSFDNQGGRSLVSYDYYLDPERSVDDAEADIRSLARLNPQRPYYLLIHVRQWNNINKVNQIFTRLGRTFEVVPLDVFLKMAGKEPTFKPHLLEEKKENK